MCQETEHTSICSLHDRAFEIYKMYVSCAESLSDRRRVYASLLLSVQAALLVGPYTINQPDDASKFALVTGAAVIGLCVAIFWASIGARYRNAIIHRSTWLTLMEHFLYKEKIIPSYARVFSFENGFLFNFVKPSFAISRVELVASRIFALLFLLNPIVTLFLLSDREKFRCFAVAWPFCGAFLGLILWGIVNSDGRIKLDRNALAWFREAYRSWRDLAFPATDLTRWAGQDRERLFAEAKTGNSELDEVFSEIHRSWKSRPNSNQ